MCVCHNNYPAKQTNLRLEIRRKKKEEEERGKPDVPSSAVEFRALRSSLICHDDMFSPY